MRVRTLIERGRIVDDDGRATLTGNVWWTLSVLHPGLGGGGVWLFPTVEWCRSGPETDVEVHWLLWGVALWWQS